MAELWTNLSERERWLIGVAGTLFLVFAVFQFMLKPIFDWRTDARRSAANAEATYRLVAEAATQAGAASGRARVAGQDQPLRAIISRTASQNNVNLVYVNASAETRIDVNASSVDPAALYQWLTQLEREYGVNVETADIAREQGDIEKVRAQLALSRGAQ